MKKIGKLSLILAALVALLSGCTQSNIVSPTGGTVTGDGVPDVEVNKDIAIDWTEIREELRDNYLDPYGEFADYVLDMDVRYDAGSGLLTVLLPVTHKTTGEVAVVFGEAVLKTVGASPFIMQSTESLITVCFNSSLLKYGGDIAVGAMTVLSSIMQFAMMPLQGLTQGAQPIISYNYGARNPGRVRRAFQVLLMACLAYSLLLWALVQLFPQLFALMFTSDSELVSYASWALRIYMAATGIFGIQIACQQTFVALGNAKISLFLAVLRKIILLIPFIYILPNFFADKAFAVFLAEPVADFLAVCTTATMFAVHFKKSMTALEGKPGV